MPSTAKSIYIVLQCSDIISFCCIWSGHFPLSHGDSPSVVWFAVFLHSGCEYFILIYFLVSSGIIHMLFYAGWKITVYHCIAAYYVQ